MKFKVRKTYQARQSTYGNLWTSSDK